MTATTRTETTVRVSGQRLTVADLRDLVDRAAALGCGEDRVVSVEVTRPAPGEYGTGSQSVSVTFPLELPAP